MLPLSNGNNNLCNEKINKYQAQIAITTNRLPETARIACLINSKSMTRRVKPAAKHDIYLTASDSLHALKNFKTSGCNQSCTNDESQCRTRSKNRTPLSTCTLD